MFVKSWAQNRVPLCVCVYMFHVQLMRVLMTCGKQLDAIQGGKAGGWGSGKIREETFNHLLGWYDTTQYDTVFFIAWPLLSFNSPIPFLNYDKHEQIIRKNNKALNNLFAKLFIQDTNQSDYTHAIPDFWYKALTCCLILFLTLDIKHPFHADLMQSLLSKLGTNAEHLVSVGRHYPDAGLIQLAPSHWPLLA